MFSVCTARALTWLLLALRRIDHHGIRCLHGLRLPLEHLRRQPGGGAASARPSAWFGLGALQFWQRKARRDEPVAHHTPHPADPGGGCLRASRLLRSLRGFEHAIANGAASAAAASEAQPQEEGEDVSDEHRRSITSVTTVPDDDHLASSSSSALALPEAVRHGHALWLAVLVSTEMGLRRWAATPAAHRVGPRVFNARSFRAVLEGLGLTFIGFGPDYLVKSQKLSQVTWFSRKRGQITWICKAVGQITWVFCFAEGQNTWCLELEGQNAWRTRIWGPEYLENQK